MPGQGGEDDTEEVFSHRRTLVSLVTFNLNVEAGAVLPPAGVGVYLVPIYIERALFFNSLEFHSISGAYGFLLLFIHHGQVTGRSVSVHPRY